MEIFLHEEITKMTASIQAGAVMGSWCKL